MTDELKDNIAVENPWRDDLLKDLLKEYENGNKTAIIDALAVCANYSHPLPSWVSYAFLHDCYFPVKTFKAKSWDDVFGQPHKKGTHLAKERQELTYPFLVYRRIEELKKADPTIAIDGFLFERVGREFGIGGKTLTEAYYYKWKNRLENQG